MISDQTFLKTIYELGGQKRLVRNNELVHTLLVQAPSVSERLDILQSKGYVCLKKYHGAILTKKGNAFVLNSIRQHRLIEIWLKRTFQLNEFALYELADKLSKSPDELLINKLDELLLFPDICPHGNPIPSRNGKIKIPQARSLIQAKPKVRLVVRRIYDDRGTLDLLNRFHISVGSIIYIISSNDWDQTFLVNNGSNINSQTVIPRNVAKNIFINNF